MIICKCIMYKTQKKIKLKSIARLYHSLIVQLSDKLPVYNVVNLSRLYNEPNRTPSTLYHKHDVSAICHWEIHWGCNAIQFNAMQCNINARCLVGVRSYWIWSLHSKGLKRSRGEHNMKPLTQAPTKGVQSILHKSLGVLEQQRMKQAIVSAIHFHRARSTGVYCVLWWLFSAI